jgi:arylsulfatase A-like enzyme
MITSLEPQNTGLTRNGLRVREGLIGMPKILRRRGYRTGAFVGNWTVRDKLSGLAEHFEEYREVLNRKRWFFFAGEATAEDLNSEALDWVAQEHKEEPSRPIFLWVHYVEPHAPYRLHREFTDSLGIKRGETEIAAADRYDTEIAYVDRAIGSFLEEIFGVLPKERTLVVFVADHGESLGEHNYWGHGRHLYDVNLHIPLAFSWPGVLSPQVIREPALITDIAPTLLGLVELVRCPAGRRATSN